MGLIDAILWSRQPRGKMYLSEYDDSLRPLVDLIDGAKSNIKLVAGELDPKVYEDSFLVSALAKALQRGCEIRIAFHKAPREYAIRLLRTDNQDLVGLKNSYPDRLRLYWLSRRPQTHFVVFDNQSVFLEGKHRAGGRREVLIKYGRSDSSDYWSRGFDELVEKKGSEILTDEIRPRQSKSSD